MSNYLTEQQRATIAKALQSFLADTYALYLQTHNFHWNVKGPLFRSLHLMFEEQYTELATAVDEIAERIRTLGFPAPGSFNDYIKLMTFKEVEGQPSAEAMLEHQVTAHESVTASARKILNLASDNGDESTVALMGARMEIHEKATWMCRSMLGQ